MKKSVKSKCIKAIVVTVALYMVLGFSSTIVFAQDGVEVLGGDQTYIMPDGGDVQANYATAQGLVDGKNQIEQLMTEQNAEGSGTLRSVAPGDDPYSTPWPPPGWETNYPNGDYDDDGVYDGNQDFDGDGVPNYQDPNPWTPGDIMDFDGDGVPDCVDSNPFDPCVPYDC